MYETEQRMIEQAERLAAEPTVNLVQKVKSATDAATINAIRCAISTRESAMSRLLPIYQELSRRAFADPICGQLLHRAWTALLSVERDKDALLYDLHQLQAEANEPEKH
jgi:hypothetical protein